MLNRATLTVLALAAALLLSSFQGATFCGLNPQDPLARLLITACLGFLEGPIVVTPPPYNPGGYSVFESNLGQSDPAYPILGRGPGFFFFLNDQETVLDLRPANRLLRLSLAGARRGAPLLQPAGKINYFLSPDPSKWITGVQSYEQVGYTNVYKGIDLVYYFKDGLLEHDFRLAPGADPTQIRWRFSGLDRLSPDGDAVVLHAGSARLRWAAPLAFQSGRRLPVKYHLHPDGSLGFRVQNHDPSLPLVIDPVMQYLSYLGRRGGDAAGRSAIDAQGNLYFAGASSDAEYPSTPGALTPNPQGFNITNIVVTKMDPSGTRLLYSTYIGGANNELAAGVAVDSQGALYITGATDSRDFPTTANAFQRQPAPPPSGGRPDRGNCFVTKLNPAGSSLVYSTYLSGSERDGCIAIAVDASGSAVVTGGSESTNFPTTPDVIQQRPRLASSEPGYDVIVSKLTPDGSALVYSTFVGGTGSDTGHGIALDPAGNAYVTGITSSASNFPVSPNAFRTAYAGQGGGGMPFPLGDAFLFKLNPTATQLVYSTLLGGSRDDTALAVAVDSAGNAYVAGNTLSRDFPTTTNAYQREWRGEGGQITLPAGDIFVSKVNPTGTALVFSTLIGGSRDDRAISLALGSDNSVHLVGHTLSTDYPVTPDAAQSANRTTNAQSPVSTGDGFYLQLDPTGSRLLYSTYLGGSADDWLSGISLDPRGAAIVTGGTSSSNLAVTPDAYQRTYFGAVDSLLPAGDILVSRFANVPPLAYANSASYATGAVAPRLITTIVGTGFNAQSRFLFDNTPAEVLYVTPTQAAVVVPPSVRTSTTLTVQGLAPLVIPVVPAQPALFTANASGSGPGAFLNQDNSLNTAANPARPGEIAILYGTGAGDAANTIVVSIAGRQAEVLYAGPSPGLTTGLLQLNVRIPDATPPGPQPVSFRVGTAESQRGVTLSIRP
jgi:uncharacterized protein (TIGR03437 family)